MDFYLYLGFRGVGHPFLVLFIYFMYGLHVNHCTYFGVCLFALFHVQPWPAWILLLDQAGLTLQCCTCPCLRALGLLLVLLVQLNIYLLLLWHAHLCTVSLSSVICAVNISLKVIIVGHFLWFLEESFILQNLVPSSFLNSFLG